MRKILMAIVATALAAVMQAQALSLAEASARIGEAVSSPAVLSEIMQQLSPEDQVKFLALVNEAIGELPGSPEEKAAKYLDANKAAVRSAAGSNLAAVLAEVFATVPPEALTVINERFASDLFNRSADPANPVSDDTMKKLAVDTMNAIQSRNEGNDNEGVRDTFAVLMFLRSANGSPADLRDTLVANLPSAETRELAASDWIPSALGEGREKSYEPLLAASDAASAPDTEIVDSLSLVDANPFSGALIAELTAATGEGQSTTPYTELVLDPNRYALPENMGTGLDAHPRTLDPESPAYGGYRRGSGFKGSNNASASESGGYPYQTTR